MPRRLFAAAVGSVLVLVALLGRLFHLQVINGPALAEAALLQRMRGVAVAPERGQIFDRHGLPLHGPELSIDLVLFPGSDVDPEAAADRLVRTFGFRREAVLAAFASPEPFILKAGLSAPLTERAQALAGDVPGLRIVVRQQRSGEQALARHILGAAPRDGAAGSGLEAELERFLQGRSGPVLAAFVDGNNRLISGLGYRYREAADDRGLDAYLTISAPWQAAAESALEATGSPGAAVVVDAGTGDILALASAPPPPESYLNRAVLAYTPGPMFEIVVLAAALSDGVTALDQEWADTGLTVRDAFAQSHDGVLSELGTAVGAERLLTVAARLGLGELHNIGLAAEEAGSLPTPALVSAGDLQLLSIGQGPVTLTPLQAAGMLAALPNGGTPPPLRLVGDVRNRDGLVVWRPAARAPEPALPARVAQQLREALAASFRTSDAALSHVPRLWIGGKAGTAAAFAADTGEPVLHAWFGGLVELPKEYQSRRLAIVTFLADSDSGEAAVHVFTDLLQRALPTHKQ